MLRTDSFFVCRLDCGTCKFCVDKRKFGGPGTKNKRCALRKCITPKDDKIAIEVNKIGKPTKKSKAKKANGSDEMMVTGDNVIVSEENIFVANIDENFQMMQGDSIVLETTETEVQVDADGSTQVFIDCIDIKQEV